MSFLKKHYEKIILAILLGFFISSLLYQLKIITSTNKVTEKDLNITIGQSDEYKYNNIDFKVPEFELKNVFMKNNDWMPAQPRGGKTNVYTDLVVPFPICGCPYCKKLIPHDFIMNDPHKCPFCGKELLSPQQQKEKETARIGASDTDKDGIPDLVELKWGMNPKDPSDAKTDIDNDGFTNLYEFQNGFDAKDPKSRAALALRLYLNGFKKDKLDIVLKNVSAGGDKVQVNTGGGRKSRFLKINDKIELDGKTYRIADIVRKSKEVNEGNFKITQNASEMTMKSLDNTETIVARLGEPVYSPKLKAELIDAGPDKSYVLEKEQEFVLGSDATGYEKYKVLRIDSEKEQVSVQDVKSGKKYQVTKTLPIPKVEKNEAKSDSGSEFGAGTENAVLPVSRSNKTGRTGKSSDYKASSVKGRKTGRSGGNLELPKL